MVLKMSYPLWHTVEKQKETYICIWKVYTIFR